MKLLRFLAIFVLIPQLVAKDTPTVKVSDVRKVFDDGDHNAFTDLTVFEGAFYLAFRTCPDGHGVSPNASVVIMTSQDTVEWKQTHTFSVSKRDTRDPHFLVFKNKLFVYTGTWFSGDKPATSNEDLELNLHLGYAVWSNDGATWSEPTLLDGTFGHYVWRAATYGDKAFLCGRRKIGFEVGPKGEPDKIESLMLESDDGLIWRKRATFQKTAGDETAFLFERNGDILGIGRRRSAAQLLQSKPPYKKWQRRSLDRHIGGPLVAKWGGRTIVGGRHSTENGPRTSMCWLVGSELHEFAELPSGGDNSYPGFVAITPTEAVMSWYSSHEGKSSIYMADLEVITDVSEFTQQQIEVMQLGDNLLSHQRSNGGFGKKRSSDSRASLSRLDKWQNLFDYTNDDTTLDNGRTHRQIRDLARVYTETELPRFRHGCERGIEFLLEAQYENGGWPQRFPRRNGYARHITFNDGATVGALTVLKGAANGIEPYAWVGEDLRKRAQEATDRGIDCILKCQIVVDGRRTAWAQQHDEVTFEPRSARTFEPAALSSAESVGVLEFLMSIDSPSPEVIAAVEAAIVWLDGPAKLNGSAQDPETMKRRFGNANVPSIWSRLYEVGTNRPVFGDRDGRVYYDVTEISEERQQGYGWYVDSPRELLDEVYPEWRKRVGL